MVEELLDPIKDLITDYSFNTENEIVIHTSDFNLARVSQYLFRDLDCELATVVATDDRFSNDCCFTIRYVYAYHKKNVFFIVENTLSEKSST
jgi:Ni,Fe-hydrogenase III component G